MQSDRKAREHARRHQRERSISARLELCCSRSKMISVPSGETSKSPITKLDGRSVSWRSAPVFGSQAQKFLWVYSPRRMTSEPELRENAGCAPRILAQLRFARHPSGRIHPQEFLGLGPEDRCRAPAHRSAIELRDRRF